MTNDNSKKKLQNHLTPWGYTLIELLVGMTVIGLIFGVGYVSFREYSRRKALEGVAKQVAGDLRLAQEYALSGKKPPPSSGCVVLDGYRFTVSATSYRIDAVCDLASRLIFEKGSGTLAGGVTMSATPVTSVTFKVLGQGTNLGTDDLVITLTRPEGGTSRTVTITRGGEIK